jgi:hypothetical protein
MGDRRKRQTYTASPAEPGGLPVMLESLAAHDVRQVCADQVPEGTEVEYTVSPICRQREAGLSPTLGTVVAWSENMHGMRLPRK